jgi:hypothetical protein
LHSLSCSPFAPPSLSLSFSQNKGKKRNCGEEKKKKGKKINKKRQDGISCLKKDIKEKKGRREKAGTNE